MDLRHPGYAFHFLADKNGSPVYRDGRPAKLGETLTHDGPLVACENGLHYSRRPIDALTYAPGPWLCRVKIGGKVVEATDKGCCSRREIVWIGDVTPILRVFARWCALQVIDKWNAPEVVLRYLLTGDESIRAAAWDAVRAAARDAAGAAARDAALAAAWDVAAARDAALAAAWAAAGAAARDAARDAAGAAAQKVAWDAAQKVAWAAALAAAWDAARDAASVAASVAARAAAQGEQNAMLEMVFAIALTGRD
jgi:hypothetical protein